MIGQEFPVTLNNLVSSAREYGFPRHILLNMHDMKVKAIVEERRAALGYGNHQVLFNIDFFGKTSVTYRESVSLDRAQRTFRGWRLLKVKVSPMGNGQKE